MERLAGQVQYDISGTEKIYEKSRQAIADLGISMLFSGEVDIAGKGQIPTAYIYRAIIREESKVGKGMVVSVVSLWDIEGLDHLTCFTDTGVNITPDYRAEAEIIRNAVFLFHLLGYPKPKICVLSGKREINGDIPSYQDFLELKKAAAAGDLDSCEVMEATSLLDIFSPGRKGFRLDDTDIGKTDFPPHHARSQPRHGQHPRQTRLCPEKCPEALPRNELAGTHHHPLAIGFPGFHSRRDRARGHRGRADQGRDVIMMTSFGQIREEAKAKGKKRIAVAPVTSHMDFGVLSAAMESDLVFPIVIGAKHVIAPWADREGTRAAHLEIIEEPDASRALALAIDLVKKDGAEMLMRGSMDPKPFLDAVLDREKGLLKERVASLVSVFDPPGVDR